MLGSDFQQTNQNSLHGLLAVLRTTKGHGAIAVGTAFCLLLGKNAVANPFPMALTKNSNEVTGEVQATILPVAS